MADRNKNDPTSSSGEAGMHALSLEYLVELENNPWRYSNMLEMPMCGAATKGGEEDRNNNVSRPPQEDHVQSKKITIRVLPWVNLQYAIGFREWKISNDHRDEDDANITTPMVAEQSDNDGFDLLSIMLNLPKLPLEVSSKSSSGGGSDQGTTTIMKSPNLALWIQ